MGTGVALVTPFTEALTLDIPALKRVVRHVIDGGCEALIPLGTTGESVTLSADEKRVVLDTVFEENADRLPVWIGCGGNNTAAVQQELTELTKAYPAAAGFLSVSPAYNKPSQAGIYAHYKALTEATDKPLIVYNVPGRTASNILPETILKLADDLAQITAVKDASGDLDQSTLLAMGAPKDFRLFSGDDPLALSQVALGYHGCISVVANAYPMQYSNLIRWALRGDFEQARTLLFRLVPIIKLLFREGNPVGVKSALSAMNLMEPYVRLPLQTATPALKADLMQAVRMV